MLISMKRKGMIEITKYKGAIVLNPKKNNKKRPVADLDFNSEYPNSIVTMNISKETKTQEKDSNIIIDDDGSVIARFKKHHGDKSKMGLMPLMSLSLLEDRKEAKRNMKEFKDDKVNLAYYISQSNTLKILANSIYRETEYIFSLLYDKEVALSVIAFPRQSMRKCIEFLESKGYNIIYRDTDSIFYMILERYFEPIDKKYNFLKIEYQTC